MKRLDKLYSFLIMCSKLPQILRQFERPCKFMLQQTQTNTENVLPFLRRDQNTRETHPHCLNSRTSICQQQGGDIVFNRIFYSIIRSTFNSIESTYQVSRPIGPFKKTTKQNKTMSSYFWTFIIFTSDHTRRQ